jgi:hypothetical protein
MNATALPATVSPEFWAIMQAALKEGKDILVRWDENIGEVVLIDNLTGEYLNT